MARPRLVDVAREAGVSVGAASDALSGKNRITEETRRRVREAATRLGYVPNPIARAMTAGHLPLVGVVLGGLRRPAELAAYRSYYTELIGIGTITASERGYALVVLPNLEDPRLSTLGFGALAILDTIPGDPNLKRAVDTGLPVLADRGSEDARVTVQADVAYGRAVPPALDYLADRGSRQPALLAPKLQTSFESDVTEAYERWCAARGVRPIRRSLPLDHSTAPALIKELLDEGADSIFVTTPPLPVLGLLRTEALARGLTLGVDLPVVILDADVDGRLASLNFATVGPDLQRFVSEAINALIDAITDRPTAPVILVPEFLVRSNS